MGDSSRGSSSAVEAAVVQEQGALLGEEVLLHDGLRKQAGARCCCTIQAKENCSVYVADVAVYRHLAMCVGVEAIAERAGARLDRRTSQFGRGSRAAKQLSRQAQRLQRVAEQDEERQRLRLPRCVGQGP